jgi:anti-sigma factor RsiW
VTGPGGADDLEVPEVPDRPCREFVEQVTDYLEGTLDEREGREIDVHLETCPGCRSVLGQWRQVIRLSGKLAEADVDEVDPDTRRRLMASFRQRHPGR